MPVKPFELDEADYDQPFYGVYSTYAGWENKTLDLYYIGYDYNFAGAPIATDFSLDTMGSRLFGTNGDWLYEIEGGVQFGRQSGLVPGPGRRLRHRRHRPQVSQASLDADRLVLLRLRLGQLPRRRLQPLQPAVPARPQVLRLHRRGAALEHRIAERAARP